MNFDREKELRVQRSRLQEVRSRKARRRSIFIWSAIVCLGIIILINLIFHPLDKYLAHANEPDITVGKEKPAQGKENTTQQPANSLQGDTNKQQQQIQQQTQEGTTQVQEQVSQEGPHPLPLGKLIDNIPTKDNKTVYLTFDDGPNEHTAEIVSILEKNKINASFFWIGEKVTDKMGEFGHQMIEKGNVIGSHTMRHDALGKESGAKQKSDLTQAASLIGNKVGHKVTYMRPPYGSVNAETRKITKELGQYIMFWDVDSLDWSLAHNPEKILTNIKNGNVKPGSIILMHERKQTVEMLPKVIEYLRSQGYNFAALPASPVPEETKTK